MKETMRAVEGSSINFVRASATQIRAARELPDPQDRLTALNRTIGITACMLELPVTQFDSIFIDELNELRDTDPETYKTFDAVWHLVQTLTQIEPQIYNQTVRQEKYWHSSVTRGLQKASVAKPE